MFIVDHVSVLRNLMAITKVMKKENFKCNLSKNYNFAFTNLLENTADLF